MADKKQQWRVVRYTPPRNGDGAAADTINLVTMVLECRSYMIARRIARNWLKVMTLQPERRRPETVTHEQSGAPWKPCVAYTTRLPLHPRYHYTGGVQIETTTGVSRRKW